MKKQLKTSQQSIKEANIKLVFNTLLKTQPITRAGLKKITKLSATTVTFLTEELINKGFIEEKGVPHTDDVGRKGILLAVRKEGAYFAGLEITDKTVKCDLYDISFNAVSSEEMQYNTQKELTQVIITLIDKSLQMSKNKLYGAAIGVPAVVDIEKQNIISSTVLNIKAEGGLVDVLKSRYKDLYITLFNNSGFVAYAEKETRENINNLISIDINEGVGAGLIISGKLYTGSYGHSGEFGHMTVDYKGEKCRCGCRGCLEGYVNINALTDEAVKSAATNNLTFDGLVNRIKNNDEAALKTVKNAAEILAYGINNIVNLFEPEIIVISGKITKLGDAFINAVKSKLNKISLSGSITAIEYSQIIGNAVTLGAAYFVFRKCFS